MHIYGSNAWKTEPKKRFSILIFNLASDLIALLLASLLFTFFSHHIGSDTTSESSHPACVFRIADFASSILNHIRPIRQIFSDPHALVLDGYVIICSVAAVAIYLNHGFSLTILFLSMTVVLLPVLRIGS